MKNRKTRRASALIFVLGLVFAASAISLALVEYATADLKPRTSILRQQILRQEAYSALSAAIAVIEEYNSIDGGIYSDLQGWDKPLSDGRVKLPEASHADVKVTDESAKISLRGLDSASLAKIIEYLGLSERDAETCADCIIDWCDEDEVASLNGAEKDDYNTGEALPPNRPMESFSELKLIKNVRDLFFDENGNANDVYKRFVQIITLENTTECNLNCASEETLAALLAIEEKDYDPNLYKAIRGQIGSIDDGIVWVKSLAEISARGAADVPSNGTGCQVQLLKIEIVVKRGVGEYRLDAFYGLPDLMQNTSSDGGAAASKSKTDSNASKNADKAGLPNAAIKTSSSSSKELGTFRILKVFERGSK